MKKLILLLSIVLISCTESEYQKIGVEIIDGRVSAMEVEIGKYHNSYYIWVQSPKETKRIKVPKEYGKRWKVGDSAVVIVEKYKIIK